MCLTIVCAAVFAPALPQSQALYYRVGTTAGRIVDYTQAAAVTTEPVFPQVTSPGAIHFDPGSGRPMSSGNAGFILTRDERGEDIVWMQTDPGVRWTGMDADARGIIWCISDESADLFALDQATRVQTPTVRIADPNLGEAGGGGLAVDPQGVVYLFTTSGDLRSYDPATGSVVNHGPHGFTSSDEPRGLEIDLDGTAYVVTRGGSFFRYDLATRTGTPIGGPGALGFSASGLAFTLPADGPRSEARVFCEPYIQSLQERASESLMASVGSTEVAANRFELLARSLDAAPGDFGLFLMSRSTDFLPYAGFASGALCLGAPIRRFSRPGEIVPAQEVGPGLVSFSLALDLTDLPAPGTTAVASPGETVYFQLWHRSSIGPTAGVAAAVWSDALAVEFR